MSIPYEKIVAEDLNLGKGTTSVTMPGGGSATGNQINLATLLPHGTPANGDVPVYDATETDGAKWLSPSEALLADDTLIWGPASAATGDLITYDSTQTQNTGRIAAVAKGSALVSNGTGAPPVYQAKPHFDVRDYGAVGNGSTDDTAAFTAALAAAAAATKGGIVLVPPGQYLITSGLTVPAKVGVCGIAAGGNSATAYQSVILFHPAVAGGTAFTLVANSTGLERLFISGSDSAPLAECAIAVDNVFGLRLRDIGISNPFTVAAIKLEELIQGDLANLNIGNGVTTDATPAGILFTGTLSTTTTISNLYVHGVVGATGGITDGLVCEGDGILGLTLIRPIFESLSRYAMNLHKGNSVYMFVPYVENVPNANAATAVFRVGKDTTTATYLTYLGIWGGRLQPPTGGTDVLAFEVNKIDNLTVNGTDFSTIVNMVSADAYATGRMQFDGCTATSCTNFGTIGTTAALVFGPGNKFAPTGTPASHRGAGTTAAIPTFYLYKGQQYFDTTVGLLKTYDGAAWQPAPTGVTGAGTPVAIPVVGSLIEVTTDGDSDEDAFTLAAGAAGQIINVCCKAVGNAADSFKITPATMLGGTKITFAANPLGKGCTFQYTSAGWAVIGNNGGTIA